MTTVTGILRDAQQNPIPNAGVTVRYTRALVGFNGGAVAQNDRLFTTDGSGVLTMTDLIPGHYEISVSMPVNASTTQAVIKRGTGTVPTGEASISWEAFLQEPIGPVDSTVLQQAIAAKDDAEAAAVTAVSAAAGVEFPVSYAPQVLDAGQKAQARENIGLPELLGVSVEDFGVFVAPHGDPEPSQALALANATALQNAIDATATSGKALLFPEGVVWVANYIIRKTDSVAMGVDRAGGSVIKMHGSVHRDMPLCISSTRNNAQSNIKWANLTFDFNKVRWSRGRNETDTGLAENTSQADTYGAGNIIQFDAAAREAAFGLESDALTQSAFIASDVNEFDSGKRSVYTNIRGINGYKHCIDTTAPSYARGRGGLVGPRYYDPQPACGIDIIRPYGQGAGDDCITTHHCYDINMWDAFGDVPSGVRTGNSNCIEIDDGSRKVNLYGRTVAIGGSTGLEVKGHSDSPAPFDCWIEHMVAVNCSLGAEIRHLGHHSGTAAVTYDILSVNTSTNTIVTGTSDINVPLGEEISQGDEIEITGSTGNDGAYTISSLSVDEATGETTLVLVESLSSSVADGQVTQPQALETPTGQDIHIGRLQVIAPRRYNFTDDDRVVWRRSDTLRTFSYKGYRDCSIDRLECYDGTEPAPDLDGLGLFWLPTQIGAGANIIRMWLRAKDLTIGTLLFRGFPAATRGLYVTGSSGGGLHVGFVDSVNGPMTVLWATSATRRISVGGYRIRRNVSDHGLGLRGILLSGARTRKSVGVGFADGYEWAVGWGGLDFKQSITGTPSAEWQAFSGAAFTSGGDNLTIRFYKYKLDGTTCTIQGRIAALGGGGTSSSLVSVNLPFAPRKFEAETDTPGAALWRPSGAAGNLRPATAAVRSSVPDVLFIAQSGLIVGTDMTTTNGEIAFTLVYEVSLS